MDHLPIIISSALILGLVGAPLCAQAPATITVEWKQAKAPVSPTLYGLMTEEINYSYDGGIYAELIRNRTFRSDWTGVLNWFVVEKGAASAKLSVDTRNRPFVRSLHKRETRSHEGGREQPRWSAERRLLGNRRAAQHALYRIVLRQDRFYGWLTGSDRARSRPIRASPRQHERINHRCRVEAL